MPDKDKVELLKEARAARDLASRALKRSLQMADDADKVRLRKHAEQLQQQASELEERAAMFQDVPIF
jgi:hypothetical protein